MASGGKAASISGKSPTSATASGMGKTAVVNAGSQNLAELCSASLSLSVSLSLSLCLSLCLSLPLFFLSLSVSLSVSQESQRNAPSCSFR
jgi:hypothetical protein